ncbi:MAG: nucleotide disphospho-sugar-binding domain-containing protein [Cyclobacteriaceae bacterium]
MDLRNAIISLSKRLNLNVLIVRGWGFENLSDFGSDNSIKIIASAPFDKLLPHINAVIHHGGIGTIAQCLRAGVPFLSCPVIYPMGDQHFWGKRAYIVGCLPEPIPLKKLNEDVLIQKVSELLTSEAFKINSRRMAQCLQRENGLQSAVQFIENHFGFQRAK